MHLILHGILCISLLPLKFHKSDITLCNWIDSRSEKPPQKWPLSIWLLRVFMRCRWIQRQWTWSYCNWWSWCHWRRLPRRWMPGWWGLRLGWWRWCRWLGLDGRVVNGGGVVGSVVERHIYRWLSMEAASLEALLRSVVYRLLLMEVASLSTMVASMQVASSDASSTERRCLIWQWRYAMIVNCCDGLRAVFDDRSLIAVGNDSCLKMTFEFLKWLIVKRILWRGNENQNFYF